MQSQGPKAAQKYLALWMSTALQNRSYFYLPKVVIIILIHMYKTFMSSQESVRNYASILRGKGAQNPLTVDV